MSTDMSIRMSKCTIGEMYGETPLADAGAPTTRAQSAAAAPSRFIRMTVHLAPRSEKPRATDGRQLLVEIQAQRRGLEDGCLVAPDNRVWSHV